MSAGRVSTYLAATVATDCLGVTSCRTGEAGVIVIGVVILVCRTALGFGGRPFFGRWGSQRAEGLSAVAGSWASAGRATN